MSERLQDIVGFRGDRLFNGAVNIGWFGSDPSRTRTAAEAFVFHGPAYHGVSQNDIGVSHGHRLQDTARFALSMVRRCYGIEDQPFTLAIAGYGTGKSHLALTLAALLQSPEEDVAEIVLSGVDRADQAIGAEIRAILGEAQQPCLVVALNGMQSFDLTTEVTRQLLQQVKMAGLDTRPLDELRPRFAQATSLIRMAVKNTDLVNELLEACEAETVEEILANLELQDEVVYSKVHGVLAARNIQIAALGGESIRDVIDVACREYCGHGKPFRCLVFLFDEFGRYTEFATVRSHIAGSGVLQDLFEGIQANAGAACFAGFIQFELNAYVQRVAPEHRNEILRYVTRYQAASRVYLSINLETLIAHLIEKKQPDELARRFDSDEARQASDEVIANVARWYPQSRNHRLWSDSEQFHAVVRKGCWPLSAYSTWFLFHLAAAGKHLQERSALALLGDAFERYQGHLIGDDTQWRIAPVDFWSEYLQHELITSEEGGQQGSITHAYASVEARHGAKIEEDLTRLLRAVVLASKMGLKVADRDDAIEALSELAGLHLGVADKGIQQLQDEYNVLEWDDSFKEFDILGDAVPRTQFLSFVRHRVASAYDEAGKAALFASKAMTWCELLGDLDCDFAEENKITTREWRYAGVTSNLDVLAMQVKLASDRWANALAVDEPRGTIIYCYVDPSRDPEVIAADTGKLLRAASKQADAPALPILVVLLFDTAGTLGQSLAELAVLEESVSEEDRVRFGSLIGAHKEKLHQIIRSQVDSMMKQRRYVTGLKDGLASRRLGRAGGELFARIYKNPIPFPFDGFTTAKGNAADTCQELTRELLLGRLDYDGVIAKVPKVKNRAMTVLKDTWEIFTKKGDVSRRPAYPIIRTITEKWDEALASGHQRLSVADAIIQLCRPPYGANIASAGLLLSVFVSPRLEKLVVIRGDQQLAVSQWVQDGVFRGKFFDLSALRDVHITLVGEISSEWETLLDEWEQAETYLAHRGYLERSRTLKQRIPIPPSLAYREMHLHSLATTALEELIKMEKAQQEAFAKVHQGEERQDVGQLSWGAVTLKKLSSRMAFEVPLWTDSQISELQPHIDRARQTIIQIFPEWLAHRAPFNDSPDNIAEFKHKMLRLIGVNLKELGLEAQHRNLEDRVAYWVRNAEAAAEARQLVRDTSSWLDQHVDACRIIKVAAIRGLRDAGKLSANKLMGIAKRIDLPEVTSTRARLRSFLSVIGEAEEKAVKRCEALWEPKLRSREEMEHLLHEIEELISMFESCEDDIRDLGLMRRCLQMLLRDYDYLKSDQLNWPEFNALAERLQSEAETYIGEAELPWPVTEAVLGFADTIGKERKQASLTWICGIESDVKMLSTMAAADASRLYDRAVNPPATLTEPHRKRLDRVIRQIEIRLETLKIEWLVEKFKELTPSARKQFLKIVSELYKGV